MYVFTNGKVVFDKETRDKYIKAGMILERTIENKPEKEEKVEEVKVEDNNNNGAIERKSKKDKKASTRV